jgi:hypothetical protein
MRSCHAGGTWPFQVEFVPMPGPNMTYIEGWTIGTDFIPYYTRVFYLWTGDAYSKQQTVFIGLGVNAGQGSYLQRTDSCLNTRETDQPYYAWSSNQWLLNQCLPKIPGVGLPYPNWVSRDGGVVMGMITGNPAFGLTPEQSLNLIAAQLPRGGGELATFWLWFTGEGDGVLFTEGNYMNPLSHNLQSDRLYALRAERRHSSAGLLEPVRRELALPGRRRPRRDRPRETARPLISMIYASITDHITRRGT